MSSQIKQPNDSLYSTSTTFKGSQNKLKEMLSKSLQFHSIPPLFSMYYQNMNPPHINKQGQLFLDSRVKSHTKALKSRLNLDPSQFSLSGYIRWTWLGIHLYRYFKTSYPDPEDRINPNINPNPNSKKNDKSTKENTNTELFHQLLQQYSIDNPCANPKSVLVYIEKPLDKSLTIGKEDFTKKRGHDVLTVKNTTFTFYVDKHMFHQDDTPETWIVDALNKSHLFLNPIDSQKSGGLETLYGNIVSLIDQGLVDSQLLIQKAQQLGNSTSLQIISSLMDDNRLKKSHIGGTLMLASYLQELKSLAPCVPYFHDSEPIGIPVKNSTNSTVDYHHPLDLFAKQYWKDWFVDQLTINGLTQRINSWSKQRQSFKDYIQTVKDISNEDLKVQSIAQDHYLYFSKPPTKYSHASQLTNACFFHSKGLEMAGIIPFSIHNPKLDLFVDSWSVLDALEWQSALYGLSSKSLASESLNESSKEAFHPSTSKIHSNVPFDTNFGAKPIRGLPLLAYFSADQLSTCYSLLSLKNQCFNIENKLGFPFSPYDTREFTGSFLNSFDPTSLKSSIDTIDWVSRNPKIVSQRKDVLSQCIDQFGSFSGKSFVQDDFGSNFSSSSSNLVLPPFTPFSYKSLDLFTGNASLSESTQILSTKNHSRTVECVKKTHPVFTYQSFSSHFLQYQLNFGTPLRINSLIDNPLFPQPDWFPVSFQSDSIHGVEYYSSTLQNLGDDSNRPAPILISCWKKSESDISFMHPVQNLLMALDSLCRYSNKQSTLSPDDIYAVCQLFFDIISTLPVVKDWSNKLLPMIPAVSCVYSWSPNDPPSTQYSSELPVDERIRRLYHRLLATNQVQKPFSPNSFASLVEYSAIIDPILTSFGPLPPEISVSMNSLGYFSTIESISLIESFCRNYKL